jgi:hypothetical protein
MAGQRHRRFGQFCVAALVTLASLGLASSAPAAIFDGHAGVSLQQAGPSAIGEAAAVSTRPMCRRGWHLRGSETGGYVCARRGHRSRPSCRPRQQLRSRGRRYVCLPTTAGSPKPQTGPATTPLSAPAQPQPTPAPAAAPTLTLDQYLVNKAFEYAKYYGERELAEALYNHVYYWKIEPNGCAIIAPNRAECVLLIYKEVEVLNYDQSSVANLWYKAIYLLGVYYEYQGPELGYRARLGQIGDWNVGPWKWL